MVAKQTEKTIYRTVDKNTQNKNTVKKRSTHFNNTAAITLVMILNARYETFALPKNVSPVHINL